MKSAIEINDLKKKYDETFELGPINLTIPSGVIIGLIGENGAGKTTLIKSILSAINIDEGTVRILGKEKSYEQEIKQEIGVVLDNSFFPEILRIKDINTVMHEIYTNWDSNLFFNYIKQFKLPVNRTIKSLSKGMKRKLEIITALSHHPKLLILDEPTSGLDPVVRNEVLNLFLDFIKDAEHTILLSTHITSDLEHIADYIVLIHNGKIVINKRRDEIIDRYGILKCSIADFDKIDKQDIVAYLKNKYNYEILVSDIHSCRVKYNGLAIDKITLEELMVFTIKGEKI